MNIFLIRNFSKIQLLLTALARIPAPVRGAQCATQAGLEGLALCLRQELRPRGVDVTVVAAGEFAAGTAWLSDASMLEQVRYSSSNLIYTFCSVFLTTVFLLFLIAGKNNVGSIVGRTA